jgi:hypothetical protein
VSAKTLAGASAALVLLGGAIRFVQYRDTAAIYEATRTSGGAPASFQIRFEIDADDVRRIRGL